MSIDYGSKEYADTLAMRMTQSMKDSKKRSAEGSIEDENDKKRLAVSAENGNGTINEPSSDKNSAELVAALQKEVDTLKRQFQRACRATFEAENKAKLAEDTIANMKAEMNGSASEMAIKQEVVVKQETPDTTNNDPLVDNPSEIAALKKEVERLNRMFEKACKEAATEKSRVIELEQIIDSKEGLKEALAKQSQHEQLQKKFDEMYWELKSIKQRSEEDKKLIEESKRRLTLAEYLNLPRARFDEPILLLGKPEHNQNALIYMQVAETIAAFSEKTDDVFAILHSCTTYGQSIPINAVEIFLRIRYLQCFYGFLHASILDKPSYKESRCCGKVIEKINIISHLCSKKHMIKVRFQWPNNGNINDEALRKLEITSHEMNKSITIHKICMKASLVECANLDEAILMEILSVFQDRELKSAYIAGRITHECVPDNKLVPGIAKFTLPSRVLRDKLIAGIRFIDPTACLTYPLT